MEMSVRVKDKRRVHDHTLALQHSHRLCTIHQARRQPTFLGTDRFQEGRTQRTHLNRKYQVEKVIQRTTVTCTVFSSQYTTVCSNIANMSLGQLPPPTLASPHPAARLRIPPIVAEFARQAGR